MSESRETPLDRAPMWTLGDLCRKLRCTPETVYTWRKQGIASRAYKIGKHQRLVPRPEPWASPRRAMRVVMPRARSSRRYLS